MLLGGIGVGIYFAFFNRGGGGPLLGGNPLELPNPNVTEASYTALKDGITLAEAESLLGPSRVPTAADFDLIFGDPSLAFGPERQTRGNWEENNRRGLVRAWSNGGIRILVLFNRAPSEGGRGIGRAIRYANGGVLSEMGSGLPPNAPMTTGQGTITFGPMPQPGANDPPLVVALETVLAAYAADKAAAQKFYFAKRIQFAAKIYSKEANTAIFKINSGAKASANFDQVSTAKLATKKVGDTTTITGKVLTYLADGKQLMLQGCTLND